MNASSKFYGERLTEARIARGLTQLEVSELSGISRQSLSNYEKNKQTPQGEALGSLVRSLNIPATYLQKPLSPQSPDPIYFRSKANLAQKEWNKAKVKLSWFEDFYSYLNEVVNFVPANIPLHLDISNRYKSVTDDEIEDIAIAVREYWELGLGPISDLTLLMENNGIIIINMPLNVKAEDAFSQWQSNNEVPVVVMVAEDGRNCRDRFSLAHELGHLILHRKVSDPFTDLKLIEHQANRFASSFLMPARSYLNEFRYPSLDIFTILKERWKTSIQAQLYRCKDLGILSEGAYKNFQINISKRRWRNKEPLDDVIPPERPKVTKKVIDLIRNELHITLEDIAATLSLPMNDLATFCGFEYEPEREEVKQPKIRTGSKVLAFKKN